MVPHQLAAYIQSCIRYLTIFSAVFKSSQVQKQFFFKVVRLWATELAASCLHDMAAMFYYGITVICFKCVILKEYYSNLERCLKLLGGSLCNMSIIHLTAFDLLFLTQAF